MMWIESREKTIKNIFSDVNMWYFETYWGEQASVRPADYFSKNYPFVKRVQFMTATGGNEFDYTVAALEDAIGADNLIVGAHGMVCHPGLWDELDFIDHVAKGTNHKTGKTGTQIDFIAASFYDQTPGKPNEVNLSLSNTIESLRNRAVANGLPNLKYGIDEGRILNGPDGQPLGARIVAHSKSFLIGRINFSYKSKHFIRTGFQNKTSITNM